MRMRENERAIERERRKKGEWNVRKSCSTRPFVRPVLRPSARASPNWPGIVVSQPGVGLTARNAVAARLVVVVVDPGCVYVAAPIPADRASILASLKAIQDSFLPSAAAAPRLSHHSRTVPVVRSTWIEQARPTISSLASITQLIGTKKQPRTGDRHRDRSTRTLDASAAKQRDEFPRSNLVSQLRRERSPRRLRFPAFSCPVRSLPPPLTQIPDVSVDSAIGSVDFAGQLSVLLSPHPSSVRRPLFLCPAKREREGWRVARRDADVRCVRPADHRPPRPPLEISR